MSTHIEYRNGQMTATDDRGRVIFQGDDLALLQRYSELRESIRQVTDAVLANWRNNDGHLTIDTINMLQALARLSGNSDLF